MWNECKTSGSGGYLPVTYDNDVGAATANPTLDQWIESIYREGW